MARRKRIPFQHDETRARLTPDVQAGAQKKKRRPRPPVVNLRARVEPETPLPLERLANARAIASVMISSLPLWNDLMSLYKHGSFGAGFGAEARWKRFGYMAALMFARDTGVATRKVFKRAIGAKRDDDPIEVEVYESPYLERGVPALLTVNVWRGDHLRFDVTNVSIKAFADGFTYAQFWDDDDALTLPYFFIRYCGYSPTQPRCEVVIYRLK